MGITATRVNGEATGRSTILNSGLIRLLPDETRKRVVDWAMTMIRNRTDKLEQSAYVKHTNKDYKGSAEDYIRALGWADYLGDNDKRIELLLRKSNLYEDYGAVVESNAQKVAPGKGRIKMYSIAFSSFLNAAEDIHSIMDPAHATRISGLLNRAEQNLYNIMRKINGDGLNENTITDMSIRLQVMRCMKDQLENKGDSSCISADM